MECHFCKGQMKKSKTSYVVNRKGYHLVLDDVPAFICEQCGESFFDGEGLDLIQGIVSELDCRSEKLQAHA